MENPSRENVDPIDHGDKDGKPDHFPSRGRKVLTSLGIENLVVQQQTGLVLE